MKITKSYINTLERHVVDIFCRLDSMLLNYGVYEKFLECIIEYMRRNRKKVVIYQAEDIYTEELKYIHIYLASGDDFSMTIDIESKSEPDSHENMLQFYEMVNIEKIFHEMNKSSYDNTNYYNMSIDSLIKMAKSTSIQVEDLSLVYILKAMAYTAFACDYYFKE